MRECGAWKCAVPPVANGTRGVIFHCPDCGSVYRWSRLYRAWKLTKIGTRQENDGQGNDNDAQ